MLTATTLNFVPGSRPDRFAKARAAGAGLTVIDLEDAVPADSKDAARNAALDAIVADVGLGLRINGVATVDGIADLYHLARAETLPATILVPMVEGAPELSVVRGALGERCPGLVPLIETPRGLRHALEIASAPGVVAIMFGGGDFSGELGVELAWEPLLAARQALILASAEARIPAIDVPFIHLDDEVGLRDECEKARALGFSGKAAIHPRQVTVISAVFAPTDAELSEARGAVEAFEKAGQKATRYRGKMLERPLIKFYRAMIARSEGNNNA